MALCDACGSALNQNSKFCPQCGAGVAADAPPEPAPSPPEPTPETAAACSDYRYWAFISYSSKDKVWADWLHRAIESYGVPARLVSRPTPTGEAAPKRLRPVFRDRAELAASPDLGKEIDEALAASRYLIVICSPNAARSQWVNKEIEGFQRLGRTGRVLALIVDGEPHAGGERESFPPALLLSEPIAADARKEGDGKDNARLKLLAGMLGIGFDALKQREAHRRMRRLQVAVAAVSAVAVAFAGIALYAENQRVKAVKARQQAESVLQYMLWDLRDPLMAIGRLDLIRGVQGRVDDYYRELGVDPSDPNILRTREAAILNNAVSLEEQGDLSGALAQYQAAATISESLVASDRSNSDWLWDLSLVESSIGRVTEAQGDLPGALRSYTAALNIRLALASSAPSASEWQRGVAETRDSVAGVLQSQGDLAGSLAQYRASLETIQRLLATDPANVGWQGDAAVTMSRIGDVLLFQVDLAGGLQEYRAALDMAQQRVSGDPENALYLSSLPVYLNKVGSVLNVQGDRAGALREFRKALPIAERVVAIDPGDVDRQRVLSDTHARIGEVLLHQGDLKGARREYEASAAIFARLASSDPSSAVAQRDLYHSHVAMGDLLVKSGDSKGALAEYRSGLAIVERLVASDPSNASWKQDLADVKEAIRTTLHPATTAAN